MPSSKKTIEIATVIFAEVSEYEVRYSTENHFETIDAVLPVGLFAYGSPLEALRPASVEWSGWSVFGVKRGRSVAKSGRGCDGAGLRRDVVGAGEGLALGGVAFGRVWRGADTPAHNLADL